MEGGRGRPDGQTGEDRGMGEEEQSRCVAKCSKSSSQAEQSRATEETAAGALVGDRDKGEGRGRKEGEREREGTIQKDSGMKPSTQKNAGEFTHAPKGPPRGPTIKETSNSLS